MVTFALDAIVAEVNFSVGEIQFSHFELRETGSDSMDRIRDIIEQRWSD
jgi:hypothetical protein